MTSNAVCGLDIGASSIRALISQPINSKIKDNKLSGIQAKEKILGYAESPTKGFSKGVVTNLSLLSDSIEDTVVKAEKAARCKVRKLITNVSGVHVRTFKSRGSIHISDRPTEITEQDVKRCVESAKLIAMSLDREVIHLIPERFYIDDKMKIDDPLGLFGSKLDLDLNIITSLISILHSLSKAINLAGYETEDMVISSMGTSMAIFDEDELQEGAVIIDVGKDLTDAALFMDGKLRDSFCFPFGSDDLTQVLQDKLMLMFEEADELRIKYGLITKEQDFFDDSEIPLSSLRKKQGSGYRDARLTKQTGGNWVDSENLAGPTVFQKRPSVITRRDISNMLFPRVEEIMQDVFKKIEPFLKERKKVPRICVIGGPSRMDGFVEAIEEIFGAPVDMGRIRYTKSMHDINFACALGLTRYGAKKRIAEKKSVIQTDHNIISTAITKTKKFFEEYF